NTGDPLRPPILGEPWFLADTSGQDWPLEPIHLYQGIPFFIVKGWSLAGLAEEPSRYLAFCLASGVWVDRGFKAVAPADLAIFAQDFISSGPWKRPLDNPEQRFLLAQIESNTCSTAGGQHG